MSYTNYPNGFPYGVSIRGIPLLDAYAGQVFWVDSVLGSDNYDGTREYPFATIQCAINNAIVTSRGDIIVCKPNHVETVIAAAGLVFNKTQVLVVFLGQGAGRATISFGGVTGADMDVDSIGVTLLNPRFTSVIDALTGPIDVNAADFSIVNGRWLDSVGLEARNCIVADANADRLLIDTWKYYVPVTGVQNISNIAIAATDDVILRNVDIRGNFSVGCINNSAAALNFMLQNLNLNNLANPAVPAMAVHANTTGWAKCVKCRIFSGVTYTSDVGKINWSADCEGFNTDGGAGEPLGTILATGIEGKVDILTSKVDVVDAYFDVPVADAAGNTTMRDVIGIKTDAAAAGAVSNVESLMAYAKQLVTELQVVDGLLDAPIADAVTDVTIRDAIGRKTDTNAGTSLMAKQLIPTADVATNVNARDVIGNKADAAAAGAVTNVESIMAYAKQLVTELQVVDGLLDVPVADAVGNTTIRDVVGIKTDAGVQAVAADKSQMAYTKGILDILAGAAGVAAFPAAAIPANAVSLAEVLREMYDQQEKAINTAAAIMSDNLTIFTVAGGPILLLNLLSICITDNDATASLLSFDADPTDGAATALTIASGSLASKAAGYMCSMTGTVGAATTETAVGAIAVTQALALVIPIGIIALTVATGSTSGTWAHYLRYKPLGRGVTVTAAF